LALERYDFDGARRHFLDAQELLSDTTPKFYNELVAAGVGLSSLEMGSLREARAREAQLGPLPKQWYYDPTIVLVFRSKLLERRGERRAAVELLSSQCATVKKRFPMAWIRIEALRLKMAQRSSMLIDLDAARDAADAASRLGLRTRNRELIELLEA
jgi:hypothetical protein